MKSLPGSQPLLGEIPPELVTGILGRSFDATPCVWLPFRSVFPSCPSLLLSLRLVLSLFLFLFLVLLLFCSVSCSSSSPLFSPFFFSSVVPPSSHVLPLSVFFPLLHCPLSPVFLLSHSVFLPSSSSVQSSSAAFIGQRRLCAGNGWLCNGLQRDDSRDTCPIIEENWHCFCKKTYLGLYC